MTQQQLDPIQRAAQFLHRQGEKGFEDLAALIRQTEEDWARCLDGLSEAQASHQPAPGASHVPGPASGEGPRWCAKEAVGHWLLTEKSLNNTVAGFAGVDPPPNPPPPVRTMGAQSSEYESLPIETLRAKITEFFRETIDLIRRLEKSASLDATFPHPVFGQLNLKEWIAFHRLHALDHIQQIEGIKADPGYPKA